MHKDVDGYWQQKRAFVAVNRKGVPLIYSVSQTAADCRKCVEDVMGESWEKCKKAHGWAVSKCAVQIDLWG